MAESAVPARDPYGHRAIWTIATPMILSSVTAPLVGLIGTGVIGHLDDAVYLAGVAAAAQIFAVLFTGLNFLRMGTTGLTAQAFGSGSPSAVRHSLGEAVLVALLMGLLVIVAQVPLRDWGLDLLGAEPAVAAQARLYFDIRIWSAPAALLNFVTVGWLLGMQNGRGPLAIALTINLCNIALDLWLVLALGYKVPGAAAGALIAEYLGAAVGLWLVRRELERFPGTWNLSRLLDLGAYRRLFAVNGNLFIRTLALMFTFSFITAQGARMGTVFLAANALLMNFQWIISFALDGIANAVEALVGRAVGARDRAGLLAAVRRTLAWSVGFAVLFTAAYLLAGGWLIDRLTSLPEIRSAAREYLPWLILSPLVSVWSFFYDGVYVGATRSREMRIIMTVAAFLVFLPCWYIFRELGNHAIWLAFTLFMAARGLGMHWWFRRLAADDALLRPDAAATH